MRGFFAEFLETFYHTKNHQGKNNSQNKIQTKSKNNRRAISIVFTAVHNTCFNDCIRTKNIFIIIRCTFLWIISFIRIDHPDFIIFLNVEDIFFIHLKNLSIKKCMRIFFPTIKPIFVMNISKNRNIFSKFFKISIIIHHWRNFYFCKFSNILFREILRIFWEKSSLFMQ